MLLRMENRRNIKAPSTYLDQNGKRFGYLSNENSGTELIHDFNHILNLRLWVFV